MITAAKLQIIVQTAKRNRQKNRKTENSRFLSKSEIYITFYEAKFCAYIVNFGKTKNFILQNRTLPALARIKIEELNTKAHEFFNLSILQLINSYNLALAQQCVPPPCLSP